MTGKNSNPYFQSLWRKIGLGAIAIAAVMAIASIPMHILHDTVAYVVRISTGELPENVIVSTPLLTCILYWTVWLAALLTALYMALLDIRYIRLLYVMEKRQLYLQSLGDDLAAKLLSENRKN